jgi:hypothetical protein
MSGFSDAWLGLREPLDSAARDPDLVAGLVSATPHRPIVVTDLACGTGANLRYLGPRLGGRQDWRLIDHDDALLEAIPARLDAWASTVGATLDDSGGALTVRGEAFECHIERSAMDLSHNIESLDVPSQSLVTAAALLDLVSAPWLEALAERCRQARATVLFALTYDGHIELAPHDPDDDTVIALVNRHQRTDKGFGPALGPTAADTATDVFASRGYRVEHARSDWHIDDGHRVLQEALLADWATAACAVAPDETTAIKRWAARRAQIAALHSHVVVGHVDLLARIAAG